jgi:hypothetical protein
MTQTMKNASLGLGVAVLTMGVLGMGMQVASAYQGDPTVTGPNYSADRHEAMEQAFADGDYEAWKELMDGKGRVAEMVTDENFDEFARAHELAETGDLEGAQEIRQELGLSQGQRHSQGDGTGAGTGRMQQRLHQNLNK